jgi:hypothetical protein
MPQPPRTLAVPPKKRSPAEMTAAYERVWRSPLVRDTLGIPQHVGMMAYPTGGDEFASYKPQNNTIAVNTGVDPRRYFMAGASPADTPSERTILMHELGHAYGKSAFPSLQAPMIAPRQTGAMTPREKDARMALSEYGQSDPDEALAQAYTNAASFLSETARDTTGFRQRLGELEGNTPGMGTIVRDLLTARPIYKQHPLKKVIK